MGVPLYEIFIHFLDAFRKLKYGMNANVICSYCAFEDIITFTIAGMNSSF
jgi:hypothetical protein